MKIRSNRLEIWLGVFALLTVAGACGITYWNITADREITRATGIKVADTLAASLEEHVNETLRDATNAAYSAALLIENAGGLKNFSAAKLHAELRRELFDTTSIARLIVADATGRVIASSAEYPLPPISITASAEFQWHLDHTSERSMRLGVSRGSPIDGRVAIPYTRAIFDRLGAVTGIVMAEVDVNYLRSFHETLTALYPASITVFNREGIVLMRLPYDGKFIGGRISSAARLEQIFKGSGHVELTSVLDGIARYFSYRPSKLHPLAVGVGLEREHIMATWAARAKQRAAVVGGGSIIFLALAALLVVYVRRMQRSEQMLERERTLLKTLVDHLPDEVYTLDAAGRFTLVNPEWLEKHGMASDTAIIGKTVFDVFDHELATRRDAENRRILATGEDFFEQSRQFLNADGTPRYVSVNKLVMRNSRGDPIGVVGINRDITALKRAMDRVSYERNLLFTVINTTPDVIFVRDRECRYVIMNKIGLRLRGLENHDDIVGKTMYDYYPPAVAAEIEQSDRIIIGGGAPIIDMHRASRYPGREGRWISVSKFPLHDAVGNITGVVTISRDITRIRNAVEEVHRLNQQLEDRVSQRTRELENANRELEAFSYSVSHDLRAPLRSILGFGEFLEKDNAAQLDADGRGKLQRILAAGRRMGELIDDLLNFSRISRSAITRSRVNLSVLAQDVAAELAEASPGRCVEMAIAPGLEVHADRGLMRITLDNLLANAWKFTGKEDGARIEIGSATADGETTYFVRDNGAGFDMAYAGKLFAPFQRMHSASEFEGTGIGLATVKRIIERHQGRIWIESAVKCGTTVYFTVGAAG
jgi:PAS domain S-box-containing protein